MLEIDKLYHEYAIVSVETQNPRDDTKRTVSLFYSIHNTDITLLGKLSHGTRIIVNQELVNDLQKLVDFQTNHGGITQ